MSRYGFGGNALALNRGSRKDQKLYCSK